jgi:hypothetical protein
MFVLFCFRIPRDLCVKLYVTLLYVSILVHATIVFSIHIVILLNYIILL